MPCVIAHGLGQGTQSWRAVIDALRADCEIDCPDIYALPGRRGFVYPELYHAFAAYCDGLPEPLNLCGLSLGGILALNYCLEHPGRVRSLALIGAQFKMPRALMAVQNLMFRLMPAVAFEQFSMGKGDVISLMRSMAALDFSRELTRVDCATLVLCGEKDAPNRKAARRLAQAIPGARMQYLPGGHELNRDAPEALSDALRAFWVQTR